MSDYKHNKGTLIKVENKNNLSIDELCENILKKLNIIRDYYYNSNQSQLFDSFSEKYFIINNELYEVSNIETIDYFSNYYYSKLNSDNSISFEIKYHDSGECFNDAVNTALENINN